MTVRLLFLIHISRVVWCKNTAVCDESMIIGMVMCHAITNTFDIGPSSISYIKVARVGFYALLSKCSHERKIFELNSHFRKKVRPLERAYETEKNDRSLLH